jgi:hypothetical protein
MIMRATPLKWLLIGLMVVSFVGRPWAQALAAFPSPACGGANIVALAAANSAAIHAVGKVAADKTAAAKNDSDQRMSADCVKNCAAAPILGQSAMVWSSDIRPQSHPAAIGIVLRGHPPRPELSPPIARG